MQGRWWVGVSKVPTQTIGQHVANDVPLHSSYQLLREAAHCIYPDRGTAYLQNKSTGQPIQYLSAYLQSPVWGLKDVLRKKNTQTQAA